jgi:uncharacterized membrane protein
MSISLALHALAAVIWVGGMFFAHMVLRPSVAELEPAVRLPLWSRVLGRFFLWVWLSIGLLLLTGLTLIQSLRRFGSLSGSVQVMATTGVIMAAIFVYLYFFPWQGFRQAVGREDWGQAARSLAQIRMLVTINLVLGLLTVAVATGGPFFF